MEPPSALSSDPIAEDGQARRPAQRPTVAVVIPAYRVSERIMAVLAAIGQDVAAIYVVDDGCPENTGRVVQRHCTDARVQVILRRENGGVGAAVKAGYEAATRDGHEIIVKLDGDGQMDPRLIPTLVRPIRYRKADYVKGNRFFNPEDLRDMPRLRLIGNAIFSFLTKLSTGYWQVFDPTNGFTAIHVVVLRWIPLRKVADRYFFESDMLFRLGVLRAVVMDIPMPASYSGEKSSLSVRHVMGPFLIGHLRSLAKRLMYSYFLRGFSIASVELVLGLLSLLFGVVFGVNAWFQSIATGQVATSGQVMIAALPIILAVQLLLSFLQYDIQSVPTVPLTSTLLEDEDHASDK